MIAPAGKWKSDLEARVREMFGPDGLLSKARNFEYRKVQQDMATAVARALEDQRHLVVEAGTGVGKSLAYLLPAVEFAREHGRKALICTHTINLQEQLFHKDLPLLEKLLPYDLNVALLKGRHNYICPHRLRRAMSQSGDLFQASQQAELQRLWDWMQRTTDGTLSDLDPQPDMRVWMQVCSEAHLCTPRTCGHDPKCFYQQARKKLIDADLVILNHTLFFNCLGGLDEETRAEDGYLFANDFVIFDEAHNLESVAARHIGINVSASNLRYLLQRLYHPTTRKGLLKAANIEEAQRLATVLLDESEQFFARVENACEFGQSGGGEYRVRKPGLVEDTLSLHLLRLREVLMGAAAEEENDEGRRAELRDASRRLGEVQSSIATFLEQQNEDYVYWAERTNRGYQASIELHGAPVDLAETMRQLVFGPGRTAIITSATLSTDKGLGYIQERIGAIEADTVQLDSPFDYSRQMKVLIPKRMPEPSDRERYEEALERWIKHLLLQTHGRAFVLFTSYQSMQRVAATMEQWTRENDMTLFVQGGGLSRRALVDAFKASGNGVLFGTDSFWQGVDVAGDALVNVILTRLPFQVPTHPLTQAKTELIESRGGDSFRDYSLPEAVLKFRQGIGRLIRTGSDSGQVAILDGRILSKNYGKRFLSKLPDCPVLILEDEVTRHSE